MNPNRRKQWCLIFGKPASSHPAPHHYAKFVGTPVLDANRFNPRLFFTKLEATKFASDFVKRYHNRWELIVQKYNPRTTKNNPTQICNF